jgi:SagB-type dehydrogenase family enzyme
MRLVAIGVLGVIGILACARGAMALAGLDERRPTDAAASPGASVREGRAPDARLGDSLRLPEPATGGRVSVEEAIQLRRSVRQFTDQQLSPAQIGQLCWAGQGITDQASGHRAAPSAGATFPVELYVVSARGVHHYRPAEHVLQRHLGEDVRAALQEAALGQEAVGQAPVCVVIAATVERTARRYGERAERYCMIEAGHVAQNILLQAAALGLAGVPVGAYEDEQVSRVLTLPGDQKVVYLLPLGQPRR